ncbi:hypothetical protein LSUE1_G003602 [Lachnellula suecica]|uniref:P-loop containing nucleoside triphosphate hydrolase n=1 Tax=Lachnellula suecica TaxID=602035 RepID=A0A8T9CD87_9HELO|nr:hypothetical protein LSUE1_G003602 [Lachnellula suecica]
MSTTTVTDVTDVGFQELEDQMANADITTQEVEDNMLKLDDVRSANPSTLNPGFFTPSSPVSPYLTPMSEEEAKVYGDHMRLLNRSDGQSEIDEAITTPVFTMPVLNHLELNSKSPFAQYGLVAGEAARMLELTDEDSLSPKKELDARVFFNIASPSSTFICGSQGSGKSHTLSCLLENSLFPSVANELPRPLTGLVFHYDTFISDEGGSPCEAAFLSSNPDVKVRVLCAPTNIGTIKKAYHQFKNVTIEPLRINQTDLNTKRMLDLMSVTTNEGSMPLYIHTIYRILRSMRLVQQERRGTFDYMLFKEMIDAAKLHPSQLGPLQQRLDTLESFMPSGQTAAPRPHARGLPVLPGNDWTPKAGHLTIVDLSCPCVTPEGACALFNICLSIFLEKGTEIGRVIALDEAHKYMNASAEASTLTETLLSTVRLQRHLGARIIISTQEPTISPALLDLCSSTIVHRFTSPDWLRALQAHLAGASKLLQSDEEQEEGGEVTPTIVKIFNDIVKLKVGEALLFSPSAIIGVDKSSRGAAALQRLGAGYLKIRVRSRLTTDGGKSVMAA